MMRLFLIIVLGALVLISTLTILMSHQHIRLPSATILQHPMQSSSDEDVAPVSVSTSSGTVEGSESTQQPPTANRTALSVLTTIPSLFPSNLFYTVPEKDNIRATASARIEECKKLNSPNYNVQVYGDDECRQFVSEHYPQFLASYDALPEPVMRADMWRYLVLHKYGGVYLDSDIQCLHEFNRWASMLLPSHSRQKSLNIGAMVGIEFRDNIQEDEQEGMPKAIQFVQWTLAGKAGHPIFYRTAEKIHQLISNGGYQGGDEQTNVIYGTGPGVFTEAVLEYMVEQGRIEKDTQWTMDPNPKRVFRHLLEDSTLTEATNEIVGDLAIVDKNAFARVNRATEGAGQAYAHHKFAASWRKRNKVASGDPRHGTKGKLIKGF